MNAEQKHRALTLLDIWYSINDSSQREYQAAELMAYMLQELIDAPEPQPVGYLYTNVQSGEYHVSDYDDDYRGPERVLWCIEPVYRKTKGQS